MQFIDRTNAISLTLRYQRELQLQGWIQVNLAQQNGKLHKPAKCAHCNNAIPRDFHHTNYNNPLEGKWLCRSCHRKEHERLKRVICRM